MDKYEGKLLDRRYKILHRTGEGGMAVVYQALDTLTDMTVAIKILREEYLADEEYRQRFRNESRAISLLSHKNIVKVYDISDAEDMQYIVMEYIDGITLKEYIVQQGVLSWKEAVHFTTQILKALQHAHDKGIVHRDVKPQNIMLLENGDIKVTDFGIAYFAGSAGGAASAKNSRTIGSVHYIAPEQASGNSTDARADIYSVGVILYEMLTGRLPFDADETVKIALMHLQADPAQPRSINPSIPEGLEEITMQAMQKDPAFRYQHAADMLMDIEDFKRDPDIRFEYRYMTEDAPTRYINAIYNTRRRQEEEAYEREKSPVIPVLSGIAFAFIVVALVMVWLVFDESGIFIKNPNATSDVPYFIGANYEEVTHNPSYSYTWRIEWDFSNEYAENTIMNQSPKAGKNVYNNSDITLTVSKGVERLLVPEYSGRSYADFSEECIKLGIVPTKIEVYDETIAKDNVINTNPLPRSDISEGDPVEIYVSLGPKPSVIKMPNCQNMLYNDAKNKLGGMGITSISSVEIDSEKPAGTIIYQEPSPGVPIKENETEVKFTVSNGNAPVSEVLVTFEIPSSIVSQSLRVEIYLDDEKVYSTDMNTTENRKVEAAITGSGSNRTAKIYIAGSLYATAGINFTTKEVKSFTNNSEFVTPSAEAQPTEPVVAG